METLLPLDEVERHLRAMRRCVVHDHNQVPTRMVRQQRLEKVDHFGGSDAMIKQAPHQGTAGTDRRHGGKAATKAGRLDGGCFAARRPGFTNDRSKSDMRFVLEIQYGAVLGNGRLDGGPFFRQPFPPFLFVAFLVDVLAAGLLPGQLCFA